MDGPDPKRHKKADKQKEKRDKFGGFSAKHVRQKEALSAKKPGPGKAANK
jgi:hypothetical protein